MEEEEKNRLILREGWEELFSIYGLVESEVWELHIHDKDDICMEEPLRPMSPYEMRM